MKKNQTFIISAIAFMMIALVSLSNAQGIALDTTLAPFYHGVASGDPTNNKVTIWTRVTANVTGNIAVTWRVSTDTAFNNIVASGTTMARSKSDYTVKVNVTGLKANRWYYYQFAALNKYSLTGRTKTLPAGTNVDSVRLAIMACTNYQAGYFNAYEELVHRNDIDAVIYLGDYIYEYEVGGFGYDASINRPHDPATEAITLSDYRTRHSQYKLDPQTRMLHQQFPFIAVWDDHEVANDSYKDGAENHDATEGNWYDRLHQARQAYFEWMPVRKPDPTGDSLRLYRKFTFGNLINLDMIDTRLQGRTIQLASGDAHFNDTDRTMMGIQQRQWLFNDFNASTARWNLIGQQVMMAPLVIFGAPLNIDQWDGYPAERERVYNSLNTNSSKNFVVLTGDIHSAWANDLRLPGYSIFNRSASAGVEFVTPSVTSPNPFSTISPGLVQLFNSHARYVDLSYHGFTIIDVNKNRVQGDFYDVNTITSPLYTSSFHEAWYVNNGEKFLRQATSASVRPANKQKALAPAVPMAYGTPRMQAAIDNSLILLGVYPNPANDFAEAQFYIRKAGTVEISVVDVTGKTLYYFTEEKTGAGVYINRIDLTSLSAGNYLIVIKTDEAKRTYKINKQ
ncbi:MAG: alkaline phosphatase D family protein [Bacteroidia bacterium]